MSPPLLLLSKSCARRAPAPARPPLALHAAIRPDPAPLAPVRPAPARTVACGKWKRSDLNEILQHNLNAECRNVVGLIIFEAYQKKSFQQCTYCPKGTVRNSEKHLYPLHIAELSHWLVPSAPAHGATRPRAATFALRRFHCRVLESPFSAPQWYLLSASACLTKLPMDFTISKHLRALAVAEFVFFILCMFAENQKWCHYFISAVETCLYGTLLGLLFRETRVCDDVLIRAVLIIAATLFAINLLCILIEGTSEAYGFFEDDKVQAVSSADERAFTTTLSGAFSRLSSFDDNLPKREMTLPSRWCLVPICGCSCFAFLALMAFALFSAATMIKLAIPESYTATSANNGFASKFILIALVGSVIALAVLYACSAGIAGIAWLFNKNAERSDEENPEVRTPVKIFGFVGFSTLVVICLFAFAMSLWLFVRLTKVWRGEELELYEYVSLGVVIPLIQ